MTEDEKNEILDAMRELVVDPYQLDIFAAIEPIIEKIEKRSRLEGATATTKSLIG